MNVWQQQLQRESTNNHHSLLLWCPVATLSLCVWCLYVCYGMMWSWSLKLFYFTYFIHSFINRNVACSRSVVTSSWKEARSPDCVTTVIVSAHAVRLSCGARRWSEVATPSFPKNPAKRFRVWEEQETGELFVRLKRHSVREPWLIWCSKTLHILRKMIFITVTDSFSRARARVCVGACVRVLWQCEIFLTNRRQQFMCSYIQTGTCFTPFTNTDNIIIIIIIVIIKTIKLFPTSKYHIHYKNNVHIV